MSDTSIWNHLFFFFCLSICWLIPWSIFVHLRLDATFPFLNFKLPIVAHDINNSGDISNKSVIIFNVRMYFFFKNLLIYFRSLQKHKESRKKGASFVDEKRFSWIWAEGVKSCSNCMQLFMLEPKHACLLCLVTQYHVHSSQLNSSHYQKT